MKHQVISHVNRPDECDAADFMLLEDMYEKNRLPSSLERLLTTIYEDGMQAPSEMLTAIVYYLLLETGFVPTTLPMNLRTTIPTYSGYSFVAQIPRNTWRFVAEEIRQQFMRLHGEPASDQTYEFKVNLLKHSDNEIDLIVRKVFDGSALCITFCMSQSSQATSIILPVNEYINSPINFNSLRDNSQLKNIQKLCENVKQNLVAPLRNEIMYDSAYPNAALHGLPKDILWKLFQYLRSDLTSLQKTSQTCVYLRNMTISFLTESNIKLKQHRPTPIIYDLSNQLHSSSRYRSFNFYPWIFHPYHRR